MINTEELHKTWSTIIKNQECKTDAQKENYVDAIQHGKYVIGEVNYTELLSIDIEDVKIDNEISILDLLVNLNFVASKGEAKRLIQGGGVKLDGEKVSDMGFIITPNMNKVLQAGKRKFAKLV